MIIVIIVIIVIIDTIDAIDIIDAIDAIKYHLALYGLKANNPINNPKISRLKRFFSLRNEIILFIMLLLEKKVINFVTPICQVGEPSGPTWLFLFKIKSL